MPSARIDFHSSRRLLSRRSRSFAPTSRMFTGLPSVRLRSWFKEAMASAHAESSPSMSAGRTMTRSRSLSASASPRAKETKDDNQLRSGLLEGGAISDCSESEVTQVGHGAHQPPDEVLVN